ncbi:unnamed protein product [Vicia faba]|uniref:Uncharacterized protein n=1 Tax=Vicia faba TaxID=3906 RepID=A0AAV0Z8D1_VICFA|nr:unnamed protein product [Vicia faba]
MELPPSSQIHLVLHVSQLKAYHGNNPSSHFRHIPSDMEVLYAFEEQTHKTQIVSDNHHTKDMQSRYLYVEGEETILDPLEGERVLDNSIKVLKLADISEGGNRTGFRSQERSVFGGKEKHMFTSTERSMFKSGEQSLCTSNLTNSPQDNNMLCPKVFSLSPLQPLKTLDSLIDSSYTVDHLPVATLKTWKSHLQSVSQGLTRPFELSNKHTFSTPAVPHASTLRSQTTRLPSCFACPF